MSRENVEVARRAFRLFERQGLEGVLELIHPEFESRDLGPWGDAYRGPKGFLGYFQDWLGIWDDFDVRAEEFFDAGEQVVVFAVQRGRGRRSGVETHQQVALLLRMSGGQIIELRVYPDRAKALQVADLTEQAGQIDSS